MEVHYISPSILPSLSANSVHVIRQTRALADKEINLTLYASRSVPKSTDLLLAINQQYGVSLDGIRLLTVYVGSGLAVNVKIAFLAVFKLLFCRKKADLIISRNLYASYLMGVLARQPHVFEIHDVETGIRGKLLNSIMKSSWIQKVVISKKLEDALKEAYEVEGAAMKVLHDAAPSGITPVPPGSRRKLLAELVPQTQSSWCGVCGYFGHLFPGRGIEIIEAMASERPDILFLVVGGREEDVKYRRGQNSAPNLVFLGYLPHQKALELSKCVDVLLMPYQRSVSVGATNRDTAQWMSPIKMFEYMAAGVPIISSDLPVLGEVLSNEENSILVQPDDVNAWLDAVDRLLTDAEFAQYISANAHQQYLAHHTWDHRASELINALK